MCIRDSQGANVMLNLSLIKVASGAAILGGRKSCSVPFSNSYFSLMEAN